MVRLVCFHFFSTSRTTELVIAGIGIADTDLRLQVPMLTEKPCIAVCHTRAYEPALVAGIFQLAGIRSQQVDFAVESADVVLSAVQMRAKKCAPKRSHSQ